VRNCRVRNCEKQLGKECITRVGGIAQLLGKGRLGEGYGLLILDVDMDCSPRMWFCGCASIGYLLAFSCHFTGYLIMLQLLNCIASGVWLYDVYLA